VRRKRQAARNRALGKAMTDLMVRSTLGLLAVFAAPSKPKPARRRPPAARRPKVAVPHLPAARTAGSLGAVLAQLRAARAALAASGFPTPAQGRAAAPAVPEAAPFLARTHVGPAGALDYRLYLPSGRADRPAGLILMLHGCSQDPEDFAAGTGMNAIAERHGLAVAYPAQAAGHNASGCWNWFRPGDQRRGAGEPAVLAALAGALAKELGLRREAVFVAGLSAGGAMSAILADVYPDVFAAAGVHSGLVRGAAGNVLSAMTAMRSGATNTPHKVRARRKPVRRIVFHGDADTTVHPSNAPLIVVAAVGAAALPISVHHASAGGRRYVRSHFAAPGKPDHLELWQIEGGGHAWSGGRAAGSFTDPKGPDASAEMVRFFLAKPA
jgi:poly(hydroxyalkanoate) depolymerase family esterase